jgi:8-oxo-dGTP pyrophosphatase MutT (NUDIX family)
MTEMIPRPAATILLARDSERGMEVLMLQRNFESAFVPGVHRFPGGTLDEEDRSPALHALCDGPDDATASSLLGMESGGLAYWIAAIRELFEEAGVLLARDAGDELLSIADDAAAAHWRRHRENAEAGTTTFGAIMAAERLRLAADRLTYFSRWITPQGAVRRYDTRFFFAVAPERQAARHDNREAIAHEWALPRDVLERHARGECKLRTPTRHTLERCAAFDTTRSLSAALRSSRDVPAIEPRVALNGRVVMPGEPGYDEAASAAGRGEWRP